MSRILKYEIKVGLTDLPKEAQILKIAPQGDKLMCWAIVNQIPGDLKPTFVSYHTGAEMHTNRPQRHVDTFIFENDDPFIPFYVLHVFKII